MEWEGGIRALLLNGQRQAAPSLPFTWHVFLASRISTCRVLCVTAGSRSPLKGPSCVSVLLGPVCAVDSFGEDDELTTSSDSGDEVMKHFEISVPRSQSSHTGLTETCPMAAAETRATDSCPPAEQRRGGREPSSSRGTPTGSLLPWQQASGPVRGGAFVRLCC